MKISKILFLALGVVVFGLLFALLGVRTAKPKERTIAIESRKYAFTPEVIRLNRGDKITLKLSSKDVTHGFYLEGYDLDIKVRPENPTFWVRHPSKSKKYDDEPVDSYTFIADRLGKFRYRCSIGCGPSHPFMQGEMIVEPNYLFPVSIGMVVGLALACVIYFKGENEKNII